MRERGEAVGANAVRRLAGRPRRTQAGTVLVLLGLVILIGGGLRLLRAIRARRAIGRLADDSVTPAEVEAVAGHGRGGLIDLFRLLATAPNASVREAAGHALARLWAEDQLIAEEEKAIVRRGFEVFWKARRRYPRALRVPIPLEVEFGVPFLRDEPGEVGPSYLEWSYRVAGAQRASLEQPSPWAAGPGRVRFAIDPGDFPGNGPHRLALQARVRTRGLTTAWDLDLPHMPFSFEFDPILEVGALLTLPDEARSQTFAGAVRLEPNPGDPDAPRFLALNEDLALRNPPDLVVATPLACDLAHSVSLEFEGIPGRLASGSVIVRGQGAGDRGEGGRLVFLLGPIEARPDGPIDRPGEVRMRAILAADPQLGWADAEVRSIWPGTIATEWVAARVVRR